MRSRWYNTPPKPNTSTTQQDEDPEDDVGEVYLEGDEGYYEEGVAENSGPVEAELYHRAQLESMPANYDIASGPAASLSTVSQDEAFSRALNAMYWGGYWTAVYHVSPRFDHYKRCCADASVQCHRGQVGPTAAASARDQEKVDAMAEAGDAEEEEGEPGRDEDASSDNMNP